MNLHSLPADYNALNSIASKHELTLISDAAHAAGVTYHGRCAGSLADITASRITISRHTR